MKTYSSYKDSGIEWIDKIPENWELVPIKYIGKVLNGSTPSTSNKEYWNGNISWVTTDDLGKLKTKYIRKSRRRITKEGLNSCGTHLAPIGSVVISCRAPIGHLGILKVEACTNQGCKTIIPFNFNSLFLYYSILNSKEAIDSLGKGTTFKELASSSLKDFKVLMPKIDEQIQIANYLDQKTNQIDELIAKKEQLIKLLEEERTAIINQAVTKGLNPDAAMKDSGIDWLGEIPEHWKEARIKNVANIIGRIGFRGYTTADLVEKGEGAISLSPSNVINQKLNIDSCTYLSWEKYEESPEIKIYSNDIILVKTGSTIGKTAIIPNETPEMTLNPQLVVMKEIKLFQKFLYFIMISDYFQGYFKVYTAGGSTPAISQEKINNFKIAFPPKEEQIKIVKSIESNCFLIEETSNKISQEIELLKEYKESLISNVVTGKIDVREEVLN